MAGSVNKVIVIGNLGADPEVRALPSGGQVVNLRVATSEMWKDKGTGERKERTEWHSVAIFNEGLGKIATQYLKKGSTVYLEGQLETRKPAAPRSAGPVRLRNGVIAVWSCTTPIFARQRAESTAS